MDTMARRWLITCMLMFQINKVALDEVVEAFAGGSVILPCLYRGALQKSEDWAVRWRYNKRVVYNILKNEDVLKDQHHAYRNRTKSFPEEFAKGNFSIQLRDVKESDQGTYSCLLVSARITKKIQLQIKEKPPVQPTAPCKKTVKSRSSLHHLHLTLLIITFLLGYSLVYNL